VFLESDKLDRRKQKEEGRKWVTRKRGSREEKKRKDI
jgi:hypothetical protein